MSRSSQLTATFAVLASVAAAGPLPSSADGPAIEPAAAAAAVESIGYRVAAGDQLIAQGRFDAAREQYAAVANAVRADGKLPVEAERRIANAYYFEGAWQSAEDVLVALADEAASLGDPEAQVWAIADAAWLANLREDEQQAARYLERLDDLLDSYDLPDARELIATHMMKNFTAFAPHLSTW